MYVNKYIIFGFVVIEAVILLIQYFTSHKSAILISSNNVWKSDVRPFFGIWCGKVCWMNYVSDEFYQIWKDLEDVYDWKEVSESPSENRIWLSNDSLSSYFNRNFNRIPDLILYVEVYPIIKYHSALPDWNLIRHPWLFMDDVHTLDSRSTQSKMLGLMLVENIIATYPYKIDEEYSNKNHTRLPTWSTFHRTWLPHSASDSFLIEYNRNPKMKIFLSGAINSVYPYRQKILKMYNDMPIHSLNNTIEYHRHPGYQELTNVTISSARNAYARMINRYFAAVTDTSSKNYIVAKVFEIPAAGALLLLNTEAIPIMARLKLFENVHYVTYNETNIEAVFSDVMSNKSFQKYEKIRWAGHRAVLESHTTKRRALFLHNLAINSYLYG